MGSVEQIDQIATWLAQFGSSFPVSISYLEGFSEILSEGNL